MKYDVIQITNGVSVADPCDIIKLVVVKDGYARYFTAGRRAYWRRFLIWAIRRHVRRMPE